ALRARCILLSASLVRRSAQAMRQGLPSAVATGVLCFLAVSQSRGQLTTAPRNLQEQVMRVDEDYRLAKLKRDTTTLNRILADNFNETNQNGNSRNKAQTIELWGYFTIGSLTPDGSQA